MKNFLMSAMALCAIVIMNGCDDTSINPQPPTSSTAENVVFYNETLSSGQDYSIYRISADGGNKVKIADSAVMFGSSFQNKITYIKYNLDEKTSDVIFADADGLNPKVLKTVSYIGARSVLSPNAMRIMYYFGNTIRSMNINGSGDVLITDDAASETIPIFSPAGDQIAFLKKHVINNVTDNNDSLFIANADGSNIRYVANEIISSKDNFESLDWSPDAKEILCLSENQDGMRVKAVKVNNGTSRIFDNTPKFNPVYSPDNTKIAFIGSNQNEGFIGIMNSDGSNVKILYTSASAAGGPIYIQWSADGKSILLNEFAIGTQKEYSTLKVVNIHSLQVISIAPSAFKGYWKK